MTMLATQVVKDLKTKKHRITKARKEVLKYFLHNKKPLSAINLLNYLHKNGLKVNKTTAYREIDFLLKMKVIQEVYINPKRIYYESAFLKHHHHLICNNCGRIEDIELEKDLSDTERNIQITKKFKVKSHSLEFFGTCAKCQ
jgi:Fur family transcriptional regulator, ferric uptake regulator